MAWIDTETTMFQFHKGTIKTESQDNCHDG